jgi:hypothetical protein
MDNNQAYFSIEKITELLDSHNLLKQKVNIFFAGSQSVLFIFPKLKNDTILSSLEIDCLINTENPELSREIYDKIYTVIGEESPFHNTHDFYVEPLEEGLVQLPENWRQRVQKIASPHENLSFYHFSLVDLMLSKYIAFREKDLEFNQIMINGGLVKKKELIKVLNDEFSQLDMDTKMRIFDKIKYQFKHMEQISILDTKRKAQIH